MVGLDPYRPFSAEKIYAASNVVRDYSNAATLHQNEVGVANLAPICSGWYHEIYFHILSSLVLR